MQNRLNLDFNLATVEARNQFITEYLKSKTFVKKPPTPDELTIMGDYILWGKDKDGLNGRQTGLQPSSRRTTWSDETRVESLDALLESPTFNEAQIRNSSTIPFKENRNVFSREDALRECGPAMRPTFLSIFQRIDSLELMINFYDLGSGKRTNPPRDELVQKFSADELTKLRERAQNWTPYTYLKQRHLLVELRREQYALRDSYSPRIMVNTPHSGEEALDDLSLESGIVVLPLGLRAVGKSGHLIFREFGEIYPEKFSEVQIAEILDDYWGRIGAKNVKTIDFRDEEQVFHLIDSCADLYAAANEESLENLWVNLVNTFWYYANEAGLDEVQRDVLEMKMRKVKNSDIAHCINQKYNKTYMTNYISTIYRQRIIPKICAAARYHESVARNLTFSEEFKKCSACGRTLLKDAINFTRKERSPDGFTTQCKCCERQKRGRYGN